MTTSEKRAVNPKQFVIDRSLKASVDKVWKMWTTKEGLEKWWGPEGFTSRVSHLDLRIGGRFEIVMTAQLPEIIAHLKAAGIGESSVAKGEYTVIEPNRRLVYTNAIDFVPGVPPYTSTTVVEMSATPTGGTRLIITNDVMHDAQWTAMATMGWTQQIDKLEKLTA
ncbi:MAG TPA: SRPBCC domain-containing protein [Steroidobacteraceae bacterium]|nr:SRPBCC domain-containing protein [Steroidobacteraceae bacterium]